MASTWSLTGQLGGPVAYRVPSPGPVPPGVRRRPWLVFPARIGSTSLGRPYGPSVGRRYDTVSLLTDYGLADEFVGLLKAVIRDLAPHVTCLDLTHGVEPYDVRGGALALARCIQYVPSGIVVAVVDPGVGTARRAVAVEVAGGEGILVGPDNGLLAPAVAMAGGAERVVELSNDAFHLSAPGATFAGRDVFAPVAAHLCNGVDLGDLGPAVDPAAVLPGVVPVTRHEDDSIVAEVLWVDRYGNAQLNVGPDDLDVLSGPHPGQFDQGENLTVRVGGLTRSARLSGAFADLAPGQLGLVVDSYGLLALALDRASAADEMSAHTGAEVRLSIPTDGGTDGSSGVTTSVQLRSRS
jgi:S-adenosyl-L-methionine hydrolase (adenosine-forming)